VKKTQRKKILRKKTQRKKILRKKTQKKWILRKKAQKERNQRITVRMEAPLVLMYIPE